MADLASIPLTRIDGTPDSLGEHAGKVLLVVNVASKCGLTPQYDALEKLYSDYRDQGLVVLGVPCNQFAGQEPGTESEIKSFCETRFAVDFPLTGKTDVKGESAHPFYKWAKEVLGDPAEPAWNFHKLLVGRDGKLIGAFGSRTEPLADEVVGAIKAAL